MVPHPEQGGSRRTASHEASGRGRDSPGHEQGLEEVERGEVAAQVREARAGRFVAEHQPLAAHKLREQARLAAGAGAHIEYAGPFAGREGQRGQHG